MTIFMLAFARILTRLFLGMPAPASRQRYKSRPSLNAILHIRNPNFGTLPRRFIFSREGLTLFLGFASFVVFAVQYFHSFSRPQCEIQLIDDLTEARRGRLSENSRKGLLWICNAQEGSVFFVMPFVCGKSLRSFLKDESLSLGEVVEVSIEL